MPGKEELDKIVSMVGELPAMPAVVSEVLRITDDPKAEMTQVGRVLEGDPAMTAKILKVSNSSYYGMKQFVGTLKMALVILGVREVRNIVLGISVFETFKDPNGDIKTAQGIWDDSLQLAALSKKMSNALVLGLQGEEFITALLANIGKMVLLRHFGAAYAAHLAACGNDSAKLIEIENAEYGFNHADAASALAARWSLPGALVDALYVQYPAPGRPVKETAEPKLSAVLRIARAALLDNFDGEEMPVSLSDAEAWSVLAAAKNPVAPGDRRAWLKNFLIDIEQGAQVPL